jgi:hypothetical protein
MSIIELLSSSVGNKDFEQNKKLAAQIATSSDTQVVKDLIAGLEHKNARIQSDCIDTLYEIGFIQPDLIAAYYKAFLKLLDNKNNRLVWGGMMALATIAHITHKELFSDLYKIEKVTDSGSVITIDNGVKILIQLTKFENYFRVTNQLLMEQLMKCPIKQLPMYAERAMECIGPKNKYEFVQILNNRLSEIEKDTQMKRIEKILKKLK